jgi:hypothetical protein
MNLFGMVRTVNGEVGYSQVRLLENPLIHRVGVHDATLCTVGGSLSVEYK